MKVVRKTQSVYVTFDDEAWDFLSHITRRTRRFPCSDRIELVDIDNALLRSQLFGSLAISYSHCPFFPVNNTFTCRTRTLESVAHETHTYTL